MDITEQVARQYDTHVYPKPVTDLTPYIGKKLTGDPSHFPELIWPEGRPEGRMSILVAGCGTSQAAAIAFNNRDCDVVAVDISKTAIALEQRLKEKHQLTNLTFGLGNLLNVEKLNRTFDYIVCTGVLHHLPDPDAGLRALASVLKPNGAMFLMVYAYDLRHGVYMVQDMCRKMGVQQTPEGIALLKKILTSLPPHHLARAYLARAADLINDAGLVDTFLHPQDRAYTVPQVLAWVRQAGLRFQCWQKPEYYSPDSLPEGPIRSAVQAIPSEEDRWAVVERFNCRSGKHVFYVRKPG